MEWKTFLFVGETETVDETKVGARREMRKVERERW